MRMNRRTVLGAAVAAGALAGPAGLVGRAQQATPVPASPVPVGPGAPGVAIARVRTLPSAELNEAIYPDVMATFLPQLAALPGFDGYLFAFEQADPTASITLTTVADDAAATAAEAAAQRYVAGLDPRFVVKTPMTARGRVRIYATTQEPPSQLPPFLHGCAVTMRNRITTPGTDVEGLVAQAANGLLPILRGMPGFILYAWIQTPTGRLPINIWRTAEQLRAGDAAVAAFVAANTASTSVGQAEVHTGTIGYARLRGLT